MKLADIGITGKLLAALGPLMAITLAGVGYLGAIPPCGETVLAALAAVVAAFAATFLLLRAALAEPMFRLAEAMEVTGDREAAFAPGLTRGDEAGRLARAWMAAQAAREARVRDDARERERRLQVVADEARAERSGIERTRAEAADALDEALRRVATGDLGIRLGDGHEWGSRFDYAVGRIDEVMRAFAARADAIDGTCLEISRASADLCRRGERRAADLAPIAETSKTWAGRNATFGEGAKRARETIRTLDAEMGARALAMRVCGEALDIVAASTRQVGEFAVLIDEIAFQTTLLAFNAAVEAARAGEAGLGIAIVAEEMRGLSRRSTKAAKDLNATLAISTAEARKGGERMREAAAALDHIRTIAGGLDGFAAEVERGARDYSADAQRVAGAVARALAEARGEGEAARTIAEASEYLVRLNEKASLLLEQFGMVEVERLAAPVRPPTARSFSPPSEAPARRRPLRQSNSS